MKVQSHVVFMNANHYAFTADTLTQGQSSNQLAKTSLSVEDVRSNEQKYDATTKLTQSIIERLSTASPLIQDTVMFEQLHVEQEALSFQTQAIIKAEDKEISIDLELNLSRSFVSHTQITLEQLQDPLVLSLDGKMPQLSSKSFAFDIDSDGKKDQISSLAKGNGFLALDKNENGKIDNGSELFGATSGNGFAELQAYDTDGNGWVDENDPIFEKLRVWKKTDSQNQLVALGEVGIGAIFLGSQTTPFSLRSDENKHLGEIRKSGFFVYENGKAGVISQIDMAIYSSTKEKLQEFEELQRTLTIPQKQDLYNQESDPNSSMDKHLKQLQVRLKELQAQLAKTKEPKEKAALQVQIGTVLAQMVILISEQM